MPLTAVARTLARGLGLLAALWLAGAVSAVDPAAAARDREQPNVVVIMTDDQRSDSLGAMPTVRRELVREGTTFENHFATLPLCCPSRASLLTGQYAHNHGVLSNTPPFGYVGFDDARTLPVALQREGYRTAWVGKYFNGYGAAVSNGETLAPPPGWDEWYAVLDRGKMFHHTLNENGTVHRYGRRRRDYATDVHAGKATRFVTAAAGRAKPFFMVLSTLAPHAEPRLRSTPNPRPAPRHRGSFGGVALPRSPAFNEADVSDKPALVRETPLLSADAQRRLRGQHRDRLASLLAVDDAIDDLIRRLDREGELDDTVLAFTSDNGFMLGEHRLARKNVIYEEAARVPLVLRGPGIPAGERRSQLTANIDLAPTILRLAGADPLEPVDGDSLLGLVRDPRSGQGRDLLLHNPLRGMSAIRTERWMYAEHASGERELYDLSSDPHQLESRHDSLLLTGVRLRLAERLARLERCAGASCRGGPAR